MGKEYEEVKIWGLIIELEKLEQQGKRDYDIRVSFFGDEADVTDVLCFDEIKTIYLEP